MEDLSDQQKGGDIVSKIETEEVSVLALQTLITQEEAQEEIKVPTVAQSAQEELTTVEFPFSQRDMLGLA